jgi:hypothetical protein
MGFGEMVQWLAAKITWTWKLEMFINETIPLEINMPIFHHSIIPSGRQALRFLKNSFNINEL